MTIHKSFDFFCSLGKQQLSLRVTMFAVRRYTRKHFKRFIRISQLSIAKFETKFHSFETSYHSRATFSIVWRFTKKNEKCVWEKQSSGALNLCLQMKLALFALKVELLSIWCNLFLRMTEELMRLMDEITSWLCFSHVSSLKWSLFRSIHWRDKNV